jgi:hypothetical protein
MTRVMFLKHNAIGKIKALQELGVSGTPITINPHQSLTKLPVFSVHTNKEF